MPNNITAEMFSGEESLNPVTGLAGDQKSPALNINAPGRNITAEEFNMLQPETADNFEYLGGGQSRWNPSKFYFQLAVGADNEELRAQEQSFLGSLAKGTGRFAGTALTKTLSGLGYAATAPLALATGDISVMTANGFSSMVEGLEENIKEDLLPIYGTHKYDDPNFWKSIWTHKFWFDDAVDGAAFMASAIVGSKGISALGKTTKVYSNLAKAMSKASIAGKFGKLSGPLSKINYGTLAKEADLMTMTAYNTVTEAAFEAKDTQEQVKQALSEKVKLGLMTEEEARTKAADAALETFAFNSLALMLSNYLTNSFIFKTPKKIGGLPVFNKVGEEVALNPLTKKQVAGIFGKDALTSAASEGLWEENIQTAIQDYERTKYAPKYTDEWKGSIAERMVNNFTTKEGQKSIFLGALMGLIPGGIGGVRQARAERASEANMNQAIGALMEMSGTQAQDYYKRQPILNENGEFEGWSDAVVIDKNGKPEIDENRVAATFAKSMNEYADMTAALEESVKGNTIMFEWLRNKRLANVGFQFYNLADGVEHFESWVDFYAAKEAEDLQRAGMPVDEKALEDLKTKYKQEAKALYDLNSYVKGNFTSLFDFGKTPEAYNFKNALLYKIFDAGVDQRFWANKKEELEKELSDLNSKAPTVLEVPILNKRKSEITKLLQEIDKVTADLESKTKDLLDEQKQKEVFEQDMELLEESRAAKEAEVIAEENKQEEEDTVIPPVESLIEEDESTGDEMDLEKESPFVKPSSKETESTEVPSEEVEDVDAAKYISQGYTETTKETDPNRTFTKQNGNLLEGVVITKDGKLKHTYSSYGIEVQDTNGIKNKLDLLYVNGDLSKVRIHDTESNSEIVLKDNLPTKSNGEKFTTEDGQKELVDAIKEIYKFTEIDSTIDTFIGEEGTIEPTDADDKLTLQMDNLEQGTMDALNGVAYVSYDPETKTYVTKSKALELEAINASNKQSIAFEVRLDPTGIVENKFTGKLGTLDKKSIDILNKVSKGESISKEEADSLLTLKNIDKFDNLVDVVPLVLYSDKFKEEPVYLHTSSYDVLAVPAKIADIEDKKERSKAYAEYVRTEQYRMRKFRMSILKSILQGKPINVSVDFVSDGTHNSTKGAKNNILDVLKSVNEATSAEQVRIGIATSTGMVSMNGEEIPVGFGKMGNIFTVTMATPNGKQRFLKLNPSKLSAEHAQLVFLALQQAYTKGRGGFKAKFEAPNVEGLSIGDFLSLMVYYGEKDTKYLASNTSNSAKAYLKDKQLYVGNKGKTLFFGQFNMPLHNPTESQVNDFIKWATENKNYTINKKLLGKTIGKNFRIGNITHDESTGTGYNSFIINNNFITTDVSKVEGTRSLFKQPAVVLNLEATGLDTELTTEERESLNLDKAIELNKVFVSKNKVTTPPTVETSKIAPVVGTPNPVAETINKVNENASKYRYKGYTTAKEFSKLPNGSIIFTEYNGTKLKVGTVSDGKFYMSPSKNTSPAIKEILEKIGSFNLGNQGKIKEFDSAYAAYTAFVKIAIPNTTIEDNAAKELSHANSSVTTTPVISQIVDVDIPSSIEEEIARANAENEDYLSAFIPPVKVVSKVPNKATESFTNNATDSQKKGADDILNDILPIFRSTSWAPADYKPIDLVKETKWLRSKFKVDRFGRPLDVKHIDKLIEIGHNRRAFGQFTKDAITISKLAEEGTAYHEAFHRVSLAYLTEEQRNAIYTEARNKYKLKEYTDLQVEEYLAEEFRKYMLAKEANVKLSFPERVSAFFKDIFDLIYNFFTGKTRLNEYDINKLFEAIDKGKFMFSTINTSNLKALEGNTRYYEIEGTEFETIPDYESFKEITNNLFKLLLESSDIIGRDAKTNEPIININSFDDIHKINLEHLWRVLEIKNNQLLNAAQTNPEAAPVLNKISNTFTEILEKKTIFSKALVNYMNRLNIKQTRAAEIEEEIGESRKSFTDYDKAAFQVSYKDNVSSKIKLLVSVLPASNERSALTGLTKLADFGSTWSTLLNAMLGVTSMQGMMDRLKNMAGDSFTFQVLYNTLSKDVNAQISFHAAVRKAKYDFVNAIATQTEEGFKISFASAAVQTASKNVIKDWSNEAYFNSKLVIREEGKSPYGNVEFYNKLSDRYAKLAKSTVVNYSRNSRIQDFDKYIDEVVKVLNFLSLPIDKDTIYTILKEKKKDFDRGLLEFITKDIEHLFSEKSTIKQRLVNNNNLQNLFSDEKAVKLIADAYAISEELDFVDSVLGPSGNIYYTISSNTYMTDVITEINESETPVTTRLSAEYNKHSVVLNALKNPATRANIKISTLASFVTPTDTTGNGYDTLTEMEDMLIRMEAVRNGKILTPTPADRSFYTFIEGIGSLNASIDPSTGRIDDATLDTFYGYYLDEVNRINNVRKQVGDVIAGRKSDNDLFENYHYIQVGNRYKAKSGEVVINGKLFGKVNLFGEMSYKGRGANFTDFIEFDLKADEVTVKDKLNKVLLDRAKDALDRAVEYSLIFEEGGMYLNNLVNDEYLAEIRNDIYPGEDMADVLDKVLRNAFLNLSINTMYGAIETSKVLIGDPASFKNADDEVKRLLGFTSTGDNLAVNIPAEFMPGDKSVHDDTYYISYFNDVTFKSLYYDTLFEKHVKAYLEQGLVETHEEAVKLAEYRLKALIKVNQTDGQTVISPEMYRSINIRLGEWSEEKENAYRVLISDSDLYLEDDVIRALNIVMQPLKMTYVETKYVEGNAVPVFDKMSLAPVFRSVYKGTPMIDLIDRMEAKGKYAGRQPIHQIKFHSATKSGLQTRSDFFTDSSQTNLAPFDWLPIYHQNYKFLRRQLNTSPHEHNSVLLGSQVQKINMLNINKEADYNLRTGEVYKGNNLMSHLDTIRAELSDAGAKAYLDSIGADKDGNIQDIETTQDKLKKEAISSGMAEYVSESFKVDSEGNKYLEYDAHPGNRTWIENRFFSINKKATVDLNIAGNAFIQMTNLGLKEIGRSNDLRAFDEEGYTEAAISVSMYREVIPNYDNLTHDQRVAFIIGNDLNMMGYRIPTQGPNSVYQIKAVRFLPHETGNIVLLPGEGTAFAGFDFDIDKLYIVRPHFKNGKKIKYLDDSNSTAEERYIEYINSYAPRDLSLYFKKQSKDVLKNKLDAVKAKYAAELKAAKDTVSGYSSSQLESFDPGDILEIDMSGLSHSNLTENEKIYAEVYHKSNIIKKELPFNIKTAFWDKETELKEAGIFGVKKIAEYIKFIDKYLEENTLKQSGRADLNTLKVNYEILLFLKDESLLNAVKQDLDESVNYYNDLSVLAGLPSFEEFSSMPLERQNTKQALENRLLDIYNAVSFNDYTLITKTTPLGFAWDMLKDLSKLVREKRGEAAEDKRPLANRNITFQLDAKAKYKFGGAGIGPMALGNVHHALAQVYDLKLNTNLGVGNVDETTGLTSLAGVLGQDKRYISDWYSALIDAHVDIAADPFIYYLNVNDSTRNVLSLLIRAGVGLNSFYFIAQPSLVEIAKNIEMKSNKLNVEFPGLVKSIRTKIAEYESEGITLDPNYDSIFSEVYNNIFDINILDRGLDTVAEKDAKWYATQVAVMTKFLELLPLGDSLSAAMMASRVDTKKYGNNTIESLEYMRAVEKVIKEGTIVNIDKLLEDSYLASMHKNSIELTVKTIGKMVLNSTPAFIDATQRIAIKQGAYTYDTAKKLEAISKELYTQIASEFFIKSELNTPKKFKGIVAGENSVAKRVSRIKNLEEHAEYATNKLIQRLTPIYETGKPHLLIFRKSQDVGIKNDIYQDWKKLYLSENEEVKQLAIDLLYYNYISTGFNNSVFSFFDLAPAEMLRDLGYNEFIREKLKYYQENTITDEELEDLLESAWSNTNLIPRLQFDSLRSVKSNNGVNYLFKANKFSTAFSGIDKNGNHIYKEYVTVGIGDNIQLYKNIGTVETAVKGNTYVDGVYVLVPKKGSLYKNFQVRGNSTPSTLIKSNDINVVEGLKNLIYNRDYDALINLTNAKGEPVFKEYVNTKPRVEMLVENTENKDSESIKRDNSTSTFTVENKALLEALETGAETFSSDIEIPEGMFEYNGNVVTVTKVFDYTYPVERSGNVKPGVSELFESNPALANAVYEVLGFGQESNTESKKAKSIVSASFTGQGTTFEIEIKGEKKDFLLTWNRNNANPTLWGNKKEDGSYTTTDIFPSKEDVQKLVDKYIPSKLLNLINEWTNASKLPAEKVLDAQAIIETKINTEIAALEGTQITPKQKQQAQQLYSQYLDTIGVTDIGYHHSESDLESFTTFSEGYFPKELKKKGTHYKEADDIVFFVKKPLTEEFMSRRKFTGVWGLKIPNTLQFNTGEKIGEGIHPGIDEGVKAAINGNYDAVDFGRIRDNKTWSEVIAITNPNNAIKLGSQKDVEGFKNWVKNNQSNVQSNVQYQLPQGREIEEFVTSEKTIRDLAARMSDRIGIPIKFESDRTKQYKGKIENDIAYINLAYATLDTPIHEILGHPIIRTIKGDNILRVGDTVNYSTILEKDKTSKIKSIIGDKYNLEDGNSFEGYELNKVKGNLYQNLLKELEYDKGKEVLDRVKRDYVNKNQYNREDFSIQEDEQFDIDEGKRVKRYTILNSKNPYAAQTIYKNIEDAQKELDRLSSPILYTLEEQQEEAIVELLGLYTAGKLDAVKDGKLISLLKRLLKEIKSFVRSLMNQKEIEIDKLPDNLTINDLANILAYSNSKLILPGNEVVYTTPDNQQFKTYQEASKHISDLTESVEDVDLSDVEISKEERLHEIKSIEDVKKAIKMNKDIPSTFHFITFDELNDTFYKSESYGIKNEVSDEEVIEKFKIIFNRYKDTGLSGGINNFIEKNKEYEQSKEIIEEWKKVNNIQYNPEEVYSRGQEFVSVVGAYSDFDINLMMQNLLQHIEDNQKAGGEFTISAFTKPIDRQIGHLEGGGGKIKFKIYPQSQDIKWAANTDVYSGSVWDASEKVSKDKKSELLGVSYTKYPSLQNVNEVQPNLASIIDNLAHHHNELGISLTGSNFRLEYDENIPYSTKKIIDSINSILDQKYGKLVKPEIKKAERKQVGYYLVLDFNDGEISVIKEFKNKEDADKALLEEGKKQTQEDINRGYEIKVLPRIEQGIQPNQTNETLKENIESVNNRLYNDGYEIEQEKYSQAKKGIIPEYYSNFSNLNGKLKSKVNVFALNLPTVKNEVGMWQKDEDYDVVKDYIVGEAENIHGVKFWVLSNEFKQEALDSYKKPSKGVLQDKEHTSQALINTKIAKLKEIAKKYPRSLIRSEVKPINKSSNLGFSSNESHFQKTSNNSFQQFQQSLNKPNTYHLGYTHITPTQEQIENKQKECE